MTSTSAARPVFQNNAEFAADLDRRDPLKDYRKRFLMPRHEGQEALYFTGNSLGLQPASTKKYLERELEDWAEFGVEGHFRSRSPWLSYHETLTEHMAAIVGALPEETVMMNQLTVNLHLLMVSFYRPNKKRFKILCEAKAFPSDQYAIQSQIRFHGYTVEEALVEVFPRAGEYHIRHEDIMDAINAHGDTLALVLLGGVNYFTGQVFDMAGITRQGHAVGATVGFDLAHAAGNVRLALHDWKVDFAAWCSYKYLNSGPGSVAGAFVHEKHLRNFDLPLFAGWWGHDKKTRFLMDSTFVPMPTAERWQLSNAPVLSMAACRASLEIFAEAGMEALIKKSQQLVSYLEFVIGEINGHRGNCLEVITPEQGRGCQLSIVAHGYGKTLYGQLLENGVVPDWREPNVIRLAAVPLYNSFTDIYRFGQVLQRLLGK
jgi:kynureninase